MATNRPEDHEVLLLRLHLLQIALVYVNTLMIPSVLSEAPWMRKLTDEELRALAPLIYAHVNRYSRFELGMATRLPRDEQAVLVAQDSSRAEPFSGKSPAGHAATTRGRGPTRADHEPPSSGKSPAMATTAPPRKRPNAASRSRE